jgi:hypothetical protein
MANGIGKFSSSAGKQSREVIHLAAHGHHLLGLAGNCVDKRRSLIIGRKENEIPLHPTLPIEGNDSQYCRHGANDNTHDDESIAHGRIQDHSPRVVCSAAELARVLVAPRVAWANGAPEPDSTVGPAKSLGPLVQQVRSDQ